MLSVKYDRQANALYVRLSEKPYAFGEDIDRERRIDYAEDGTPIGVEFTCVDEGVDIRDLPRSAEIAEVLLRHDIQTYAA